MMKIKWEPQVEYVKGDKFPWKGYAVKGNQKELIASFKKTLYFHSSMLCSLKEAGLSRKAIKSAVDAFYNAVPNISRRPFSGKIRAQEAAEEYCNLANDAPPMIQGDKPWMQNISKK